jgi:two-component system, cell cycle response regulator DivK
MPDILHSTRTRGETESRHRRKLATILIVDDYEDNRQMIIKLLEMIGYSVLEADNGLEAVRVTRQERPNLVIMDLGLPLLSGVEAARMIRETPETNEIPIIILSAYDAASARDDAIASGCNGYLTKPVDYATLEKTIQALLAP